jgi:hypothetical protein
MCAMRNAGGTHDRADFRPRPPGIEPELEQSESLKALTHGLFSITP